MSIFLSLAQRTCRCIPLRHAFDARQSLRRVLPPRRSAGTHHAHSSLNDVSHPTVSLEGVWTVTSNNGAQRLPPLDIGNSVLDIGYSVFLEIGVTRSLKGSGCPMQ